MVFPEKIMICEKTWFYSVIKANATSEFALIKIAILSKNQWNSIETWKGVGIVVPET